MVFIIHHTTAPYSYALGSSVEAAGHTVFQSHSSSTARPFDRTGSTTTAKNSLGRRTAA